jgi:transposase-like protein
MNEVADVEFPTQENVQFDLRSLFQGAVRTALEIALEEVLREMVGARRWERLGQRLDRRNGTYLRKVMTSMGTIQVEVPRAREGGSAGSAVLGRYKRRTEDVDDAIVSAYVQGASTRDVGRITEALMGEGVSRSAVSRATRTLDQKVEELRQAPITEPIPYLFLDATFLDARWARKVENVSALVAYGVGLDGHRRLLGVTIGAEESEDSWSDLLAQLCAFRAIVNARIGAS